MLQWGRDLTSDSQCPFSDNLGWVHWEAVKRIYQYLKGTKNLELTYGGEKRGLVGYVDADGALQEHRRAISGYFL